MSYNAFWDDPLYDAREEERTEAAYNFDNISEHEIKHGIGAPTLRELKCDELE